GARVRADRGHGRAAGRSAGLAAAGDEGLPVPALDADGVARALRLVGDEVEAGFVPADGLRLFLKSRGCALDLLAALNLDHGRCSSQIVLALRCPSDLDIWYYGFT